MKKDISILYCGTPELSAKLLEKLINNGYNVVGLLSQEDKRVGRKQILEATPTKKVALKYNIPVYQFHKLRENIDEVLNIKCDLILTFAYGQIVPKEILQHPKYGCLNLHGSILPKLRGAAPIQRAIYEGLEETGVSLMEMVEKMDAGRVFAIKRIKITDDDTTTSLTEKMVDPAFEVFDENIEDYLEGKNKGVEQNEEEVTFASKILEEDEKIDFSKSATNIKNMVRALNDFPGPYFVYKGLKFKVGKVEVVSSSKKSVSEIEKYDKNALIIKCGTDSISIKMIQKEGKKMMPISDFYNGNKDLFTIGDTIDND